jgi:hypothetical protein
VKDWDERASELVIGGKKTITRNCTQYCLAGVFLPFVLVVFYFVSHLLSLVLSCLVCIVVILCVFAVLCVYCCFSLDARLLASSQYSEGPVTGHLDTGFS